VEEKQVRGLNVAVKDALIAIEEIDSLGGISHVAKQFLKRNPLLARLLALTKAVGQRPIRGQFPSAYQISPDDGKIEQTYQMGMTANGTNQTQILQLPLEGGMVWIEGLQRYFDGTGHALGTFRLPDLGKRTPAQPGPKLQLPLIFEK
jgi:hypothetical protein